MRRHVACLVAIAASVVVQVIVLGDEPPKKPVQPSAAMVPDPNWDAKAGDEAEVFGGDAPASPNYLAYRNWQKFAEARDTVGTNDLYARKAVVKLPKGTKVLIVKRYRPESRSFTYSQSIDSAASSAIQQALDGPPKKELYPVEVRVLDGELKGQIRFIPEDSVASLIEAPRPKPTKPAYTPKEADPAKVAATMLRSAQSLERAKKIPGALNIYRDVVKNHPKTPEAKVAAERIKAIEGK